MSHHAHSRTRTNETGIVEVSTAGTEVGFVSGATEPVSESDPRPSEHPPLFAKESLAVPGARLRDFAIGGLTPAYLKGRISQ